MSTELSLELLPSELTQIVQSVFETMLGLEADEWGVALVPRRRPVNSRGAPDGRVEWCGAVGVRPAAGLPVRWPLPFRGSARSCGRRRARRARRTRQYHRRQPEVCVEFRDRALHALGGGWKQLLSPSLQGRGSRGPRLPVRGGLFLGYGSGYAPLSVCCSRGEKCASQIDTLARQSELLLRCDKRRQYGKNPQKEFCAGNTITRVEWRRAGHQPCAGALK